MKSIWAASLLALGLTAAAAPAMAQISQAKVTGGTVAGTVADGVSELKGIPFAPACIQEPGPAPMPNLDRPKVFDAYYAWRRAGSN
jgi:hypothetical protein